MPSPAGAQRPRMRHQLTALACGRPRSAREIMRLAPPSFVAGAKGEREPNQRRCLWCPVWSASRTRVRFPPSPLKLLLTIMLAGVFLTQEGSGSSFSTTPGEFVDSRGTFCQVENTTLLPRILPCAGVSNLPIAKASLGDSAGVAGVGLALRELGRMEF